MIAIKRQCKIKNVNKEKRGISHFKDVQSSLRAGRRDIRYDTPRRANNQEKEAME
jgi:hypothetical protein